MRNYSISLLVMQLINRLMRAAVVVAVIVLAHCALAMGTGGRVHRAGFVDSTLPMPHSVRASLEKSERDLKAAEDDGDLGAQARILNSIGKLYFGISAYGEAAESFRQAMERAISTKEGLQQVTALNGIASCFRDRGQNDEAQEAYRQAESLAVASGSLSGQATAENGLGWVSFNLGQYANAREHQNLALELARRSKDKQIEASALRWLGLAESELGNKRSAHDLIVLSLDKFRNIHDRDGQAYALMNLGTLLHESGEDQGAIHEYTLALKGFHAAGDRDGAAGTLMLEGGIYLDSNEGQRALDSYERAYQEFRSVGDSSNEATSIRGIGQSYVKLDQHQNALDYFNQALAIKSDLRDHVGEVSALNDIGEVLLSWGELQSAQEKFERALILGRQAGENKGLADALNNVGLVYRDLGVPQKSFAPLSEAANLYRQLKDHKHQAGALLNLGLAYNDLGDQEKALDFYRNALSVYRETHSALGEAVTLSCMGIVYSNQGDIQKALDSYNSALPIQRSVTNKVGEAVTLAGLGLLYTRLHERQRGLDFYIQALALVQATNSSLLEANILYLMMKNLQSDQPSAAIFWGKNAVNLVQQARASFEGLDRELESAFLTSKEDYYRTLATLLIDQGRLPEAIWILDALKQQEYADYSRGNLAKSTLPVPLTPEEKRAADDYRRLTQEAVVKNRRWKELDQKGRNCTPDEKKELQDLTAELETFGKQFDKALDRVYKDLGGDASANFKIEVVKSRIGEMEKQITTPNTVGIYTLVTADRYIAIFVSDGGEVEREHAITTVDLNNKVATLQKLLSDPSSDPRPTEIDLYNIIIGPIKDDLELANAKSLIWSLDGVLRYIPLGALFDGSQYMIEQYSLGMLTSKSYSHLDDQPRNPNMAVAGMGISLKYEDDLNPLPAVVKELHEIIHDPEVEGANGVLPGSILLNGQFTKKAMEDRLGERPAIVHIASHFVLQPGDNSASYLLLAGNDSGGGGFHLTVEDFSNDRSMSMAKTELLTLSACQTAIGSNAKDGLEIDGLAMAAEQKGARSVIASMWEVDDESTGVLMADFYKRWAGGEDRVMKIEALRQAQLDLLKGRIAPSYNSADPNAPTNYAHPYYWAPFVLMGNWR